MPGTDTLKKLVHLLSGQEGTLSGLVSWGWQFALTLGVLVWLGHWLDVHYHTKPLWVLVCIFIGLFGGFYRFYRIVATLPRKSKHNQEQP